MDTVGSLGRDLEAYEKSAEDGKLLPLPGDTVSCTGRHIILTKTLSWSQFCIVNCSAIFELFFCKKIPLSRRVAYVMDWSMG